MADGIVKKMMAEMGVRGLSPAFINTGGGCMAVSLFFGEVLPGDALMFRYEILVTEQEDIFGHDDYTGATDDRMHGFFAGLYVYDDNGEPVRDECTTVYRTPDGLWSLSEVVENDGVVPAGESAVALTVEMMACVDAIQFVVQKVEEAETGRHVIVSWPEHMAGREGVVVNMPTAETVNVRLSDGEDVVFHTDNLR